MNREHPPFEFGYFSRHKYKDLVFYVKNPGENTNFGLFELDDTEENRVIMEALVFHSSAQSEQCSHWKSSANLKSDCRDQGIGQFYCSKSEQEIREKVLDEVTELLFEQFKKFTNEKYIFGTDWLADWWIERVGYLRTPEGQAELRKGDE